MKLNWQVGTRGWVRALWAWWLVIAALGFVLLAVGFRDSALLELRSQEAEILPRVQELRQAFVPLRELQRSSAIELLNDFEGSKLSLDRLRGARVAGEPYFKFYLVNQAGQKVWSDDRGDDVPEWMLKRTKQISFTGGGMTSIRPRPNETKIPGVPDNYLFWLSRNSNGQQLFVQTDLDYVFGPWFRKQLSLNHLATAQVKLLTTEQTAAEARKPNTHVTGTSHIMGSGAVTSAWTFRIETFFPDDPAPFQQVKLAIDSNLGLTPLMRSYGLAFAGFMFVMLSFALSIFLASRTMRREIALADARSNFTAMVSHELKTPVAAIRMYGEILVNKLIDDPQKVEEYHQTILDESARLQRLIENLLDLGKIERGARTFDVAPQDATGLVQEAIGQALAATPADANYRLKRDLALELPPILADRDAARQAIANLVHNALKYGGVPPDVLVVTRLEGNFVVIEVQDRGAGIPVGRRKAIFEPYVRLETEARRETQGTGLGLALVKGYMDGQGGTVEVVERAEGGSVFRLRFRAGSLVACDMTKK